MMATLASDGSAVPEICRFSGVEEVLAHLDPPEAPQTVHLEIETSGEVDIDRLRAATLATLEAIPKASARRRPWRWSDRSYVWEADGELALDPVSAHSFETAAELREAREQAISTAIDLDRSPPLRILSLTSSSESSVLLVAHHAVTDAIGALWLFRTIASAYNGGLPAPEPLVPAGRDDDGRRGDWIGSVTRVLRQATRAPARIAPDNPTSEAGVRIHTSSMPVAPLTLRPGDATVNDVLIAAMHRAIAEWNTEHSARAGRIRLMLPVNLRPVGARDRGVGNLWLAVVISTDPKDRVSPRQTLASVVGQTRAAKQRADAASLYRALGRSTAVPLWAQRAIPAVHPLTRHRLEDTAVLSNLGAVPDFGFGDAGSGAVSFSPPARMPKGLSVGCATHAGTLWLTYRYCPPLFDAGAAERFASILHRSIDAFCAV
jgi:NRPS condensation-like uncharacterized protein